jgi:hypothetical protein
MKRGDIIYSVGYIGDNRKENQIGNINDLLSQLVGV